MPALAVAYGGEGAYALSLAVVVSVVYLFIVRLLDLNEKEPLWSIATAFTFGVATSLIVWLLVDPDILGLDLFWGPVIQTVGKFVALAGAAAVFTGVSKWRGWSEFSGPLDGIVYGAAVGLGFAAAITLTNQLTGADSAVSAAGTSSWSDFAGALLAGLAHGVFGALIGLMFGKSFESRHTSGRMGLPLAGLVLGSAAAVLYEMLARGDSLAGTAGAVRRWFALLLPLALLIGTVVVSLKREKAAIRKHLADEEVVTDHDRQALNDFWGRRGQYMASVMSMDFDAWARLKELHNREVQLALAKDRYTNETDPQRRAGINAEIASLRAAVLATRAEYEAALGPKRKEVQV